MWLALRSRWREGAIESALLALFMLSASAFTILLEHPASPVLRAVGPITRHMLLGGAMGLTAISIFYSPWGRRSGAHINPATTLTMLRLGRVAPWDAMLYVPAQFAGAAAGMALASLLFGPLLAAPSVHYVVTRPGMRGAAIAHAVVTVLVAIDMRTLTPEAWLTCVLWSNASERLKAYTGLFAGTLVATFIAIEAPLSGMSMNPARSFGSAAAAVDWTALWVYLTAPPLGMLAAAQLFLWRRGASATLCAKMRPHSAGEPCHLCDAVTAPASARI